MTAVVIDTDVLSFRFKKDSRARLYRKHLVGRDWVLSYMTLAELDQWAIAHHWGGQIGYRDRVWFWYRPVAE
jgi:tRNA(fMet)-specific endonuclease VapC